MEVDIEKLEEKGKGCNVVLGVELDKNEFLRLDRNCLTKFEDFQLI